MSNKKIYLFFPYLYGFNTRAKTKLHRIAFFLFIIGPVLINVILMTGYKYNFMQFLIAFSAMYIIYEIGYIYNDTYTVRKENKPTKWLKSKEIEDYVNDNSLLLISFRVAYVFILLCLLDSLEAENLDAYVVALVLLYIFFSFHNYFRGKVNIITDGALNILKYTSPLIIFVRSKEDLRFLLYVFFETAFIRTIEFAVGNRYALELLGKFDVDKRRVMYYLIMTVIASFLTFINPLHFDLLLGMIYMLGYRGLCLAASRISGVNEMRWKNGDGKN